jgi:hypothetical protein
MQDVALLATLLIVPKQAYSITATILPSGRSKASRPLFTFFDMMLFFMVNY